jgi:predicted transcriptional regulator
MTIELTALQQRRFEALAALNGQTVEELVHEAIERLLGDGEDLVAAVHEGLASAERGELIEHEDVMAMMDAIIEGRE